MPLDSIDLVHLSRLLDEALDLTPPRFETWILELPDELRHLAPRLRAMFTAHLSGTDDDFLSRGPQLDEAARDETTPLEGDVVGPYRLQRQIGHGGMGTVWLAERIEGGLKRPIALKLPRLAWGDGLAARMARERDIGALLEHPHIARLYDAGVDALGRPFLAFEYIDGIPLDRWRVEHPSDTRARLTLFVQIVRAVAYAHGRLIVHRDLKPSNVLVTADGEAHLLDFGIAKLLDDSVDPHLTQLIGRVLTPYYASPEQIEGKAITVASDVYSLGLLLYEHLAGRHPHDFAGKGIGAVERAMLDGEAAPASTRAEDKQTARALHGELDAILAKALRFDPRQRYATADALADDLERHLAGERVLAQPDSIAYRARKVLRRHRTAFAAVAAILVVVIAGAAVALVQARRANDAAARAQVVKEFVVDIFKTNDPGVQQNDELRKLPAELLLERGAGLIASRFEGRPQLQAELYGIVGGIFMDMGAHDRAQEYAERDLEALESMDAGSHERALAQVLLVRALLAQRRMPEAEDHLRQAIELAGRDDPLRRGAQVTLASMLLDAGNTTEGLPLLDRVEREVGAGGPPSTIRARIEALRAMRLDRGNRFDEALKMYRSALDESIAAAGPASGTTIEIEYTLASALLAHYRPDEARVHREAALTALRAGGPPGEIRAALDEAEMSVVMYVRGQIPFDEARAAIERDRAALTARGPLVPQDIKATVAFSLGSLYSLWGDMKDARALLDESIPILNSKGPGYANRIRLLVTVSNQAMLGGRPGEAAALNRQINDARRLQGLDKAHNAGFNFAMEALTLVMDNRFDEADAVLDAAPRNPTTQVSGDSAEFFRDIVANTRARVQLERGNPQAAARLMPGTDVKDALVRFPMDNWMLHGEILCAIGRREEGLRMLEHSLAFETPASVYPHSPFLARDQAVTGLCALGDGHRRRALELAALARASFAIQPDASPYFRRPLERLDRALADGKTLSAAP